LVGWQKAVSARTVNSFSRGIPAVILGCYLLFLAERSLVKIEILPFVKNFIVPVAFSFPHTTNPYPGKSCSSSLTNRINRLETVVLRREHKEARTRYVRMEHILNTYQTVNRITTPHKSLANKIANLDRKHKL